MFGAIAGGIASALAGGAMSKLFGGGQKAASGGIQGDVLATDNNTVGMGDAGIKSAIQGSNVPNPDEAVPTIGERRVGTGAECGGCWAVCAGALVGAAATAGAPAGTVDVGSRRTSGCAAERDRASPPLRGDEGGTAPGAGSGAPVGAADPGTAVGPPGGDAGVSAAWRRCSASRLRLVSITTPTTSAPTITLPMPTRAADPVMVGRFSIPERRTDFDGIARRSITSV